MRPIVSERLARIFVGTLMPNSMKTSDFYYRAKQQEMNFSLAFAVLLHHAEFGRYPTGLNDLMPKYIQMIPIDGFSKEPPIYRQVDNGFVVYSVGSNGIDDDFGSPHSGGSNDDFGCKIVRASHK
jgi:hypothetical protein